MQSATGFWLRDLKAAKPRGAELFGCNLDLFHDALEGGGPGWPGDVKFVLKNSDQLSRLQPKRGGSVLGESRHVVGRLPRGLIELA